jgi:hypothetical protein
MALAANGEGVAIVPSNVSIPRKGVKAMSVTYHGAPIGRWVVVAWDSRRFFPSFAQHFVNELVAKSGQTVRGKSKSRMNSSPPVHAGGFVLCAEHDRRLGGESPLSSLMAAKD